MSFLDEKITLCLTTQSQIMNKLNRIRSSYISHANNINGNCYVNIDYIGFLNMVVIAVVFAGLSVDPRLTASVE